MSSKLVELTTLTSIDLLSCIYAASMKNISALVMQKHSDVSKKCIKDIIQKGIARGYVKCNDGQFYLVGKEIKKKKSKCPPKAKKSCVKKSKPKCPPKPKCDEASSRSAPANESMEREPLAGSSFADHQLGSMAAEIKLFKTDESPWGFRLTGGRDFGTPLTVIKVTVSSVAESAGLQVGDILVHINDTDCHSLSHKEAQDLILSSNNCVSFSVLRGSLNLPNDVIDRLTPLPLRDFKTPEPNAQHLICQDSAPSGVVQVPEPTIEIIPIKDLEPDQLEELGLNPLPEDFLEKAKRDPSPLPEVRPVSRAGEVPDILETLEHLGLEDVVKDIEKQKETVFAPEVVPSVEVSDRQAVDDESQPIITSPPSTVPDTPDQQATENNIEPISEEEFAEFMSGQEEVLEVTEGKSALGVDFKKFEPQAEFLKKSQVFRTIEESEKFLTKEERDQRWTTFLQKPKGPKPKPRPRPQNQEAASQLETPPAAVEQTPTEDERKGLYEIPSEEEFAALVRVPTPQESTDEATDQETPIQEISLQETELETNEVKEQLRQEQKNLQEQFDKEKEMNPELFADEKSDIEVQLEEIQKQLEAIQQLPFEIQQHLSLVQEQLNKIVQLRVHGQDESPSAPRPSMVEETGLMEGILESDFKALAPLEEVEQEIAEGVPEQHTQALAPTDEILAAVTVPTEEKKEFKLRTEEQQPILPPPKVGEESQTDENANDPMIIGFMVGNQKLAKFLSDKELMKKRLSRSGEEIIAEIKTDPNKKEKPRKKRPFLGIGPSPRPLILPGGRRWRTPKDAYNDEFIAETLSAQAEIITGSTLGVNFRKFDPKPVNLQNLRDSTVYKMIHDLEDPEVAGKGLASRPAVVPALQDYQQQSAPAAI